MKQTSLRPPTVEMGVLSSGGVWRTAKWDSTGYCSSPLPTSSSLHRPLFIHRQPPPASTCDCSSTGSCSSSLHRLLFNQPSPWGPVQPPLHGLLFIQPSTGYCSTSPPRGPVQPALHGVLFIHPQPTRSGSCSSSGNGLYYHGVLFIQPPTRNCSSKPATTLTVHQGKEAAGFDRLQLATVATESLGFYNVASAIAWVQLEPNASHPRTYVYERNAHRSAPDHPS